MNFQKLDELMKTLPEIGFPSVELALAKDGETVYRSMYGFSDAAKTKPVTNKDIYWIFSTSKVITCTAALRLVERGVIDINDPVSKYLPAYGELKVRNKDGSLSPAKETLRIVHLFTMTGGLDYNIKSPSILACEDKSTLGLVNAMAKEPLWFEPGTRYKYSLCHDVLAAVVEVASGMKFSDYLRTEIFEPLGCTDIGFRPSDEQKKRFSDMYNFKCGTMTATLTENVNPYALSSEYDSGGAGLFTTVDEYMKVITPLSTEGKAANGYQLLRPETIKLLQKSYMCDAAINDFHAMRYFGYSWGLCCRTHINPKVSMSKSSVGEFGWDGAACTFSMVDPNKHIALYFATNVKGCTYGYNVIHPLLRNLAVEGIEG